MSIDELKITDLLRGKLSDFSIIVCSDSSTRWVVMWKLKGL
jgi:hypothetical protein